MPNSRNRREVSEDSADFLSRAPAGGSPKQKAWPWWREVAESSHAQTDAKTPNVGQRSKPVNSTEADYTCVYFAGRKTHIAMAKLIYKVADSYGGKLASPAENLAEAVNALVAEGFQPYGNPFAYSSYICQAMVKHESGAPIPTPVYLA